MEAFEGLSDSTGSGGFGCDIESGNSISIPSWRFPRRHTSFHSRRRNFVVEGSLLEWPPFEVLLVATASDTTLVTLLTRGFGLIALESFRFARYTT